MIYTALSYVVQELNRFLMRRFLQQDTRAILSSILDETGAVPEENQNKIIVSLVNLEHETNHQYAQYQKLENGQVNAQNLPYNFNLDVLVTALFNNYGEALKFLSETVYFFQAKHLFTSENSPGLDPRIQKLSFEIIKLNYHETHSLWTALGAKYQPSVMFKVRMLSFQSNELDSLDPPISGLASDSTPTK